MSTTASKRSLRPLAIALCACALWPSMAAAQNWEVHSGLSPHRDRLRGVVDVIYCTGGGMAAAGTQTAPSTSPGFDNLIVQRLDPNAPTALPTVARWYNRYDSGRIDTGAGIAEFRDGTGFAVVGTRNPLTTPAQTFLTISKVDCNGNMVWHYGYGPTAGRNLAWDIIRADTGDGSFGTAPGDFVALGEYVVNNVQFVRVVRIRSNGALIWMRDYQAPGGAALFGRGIAEVDSTAVGTDDLVIAGGVGSQAAIFQINGNTGVPVCGQQLSALGTGRFNDVARHGGVNNIAPGFTAVGETTSAASTQQQAFVASFRNLACVLQRQIHWGQSAESESAQSVTTTFANSVNNVPQGQLLIVGNVTGPFGGVISNDVWSHVMVPITLAPFAAIGYSGQRYGTNGIALAGAERAESVAIALSGGYLVGNTSSNWTGAGDLQGYSVRMSVNSLRTACSVPWSAPTVVLNPVVALQVASTTVGPWVGFPVLPRSPINPGFCCNFALP